MKKKIAVSLLAVMLLLVFAGCGSNMVSYDSGSKEYESAIYPSSEKTGGLNLSYSSAVSEKSTVETQKLIREVSITGETKEYEKTVEKLNELIEQMDGYVGSMSSNGRSYGDGSKTRNLYITAMIPAEKLDDFLAGSSAIINVTNTVKNTENVTEKYYDVEAKLETLNTERASLLEMMSTIDTAKDYDFWYTLHTRLTEIEEEIASYEAIIKNYDKLVAYSTVTVNLYEVLDLTVTNEKYTFGQRLSDTFGTSWRDFGEGFLDFTVFMVAAFPTLLTLAIIGFSIWGIVMLIIRGAKRRHAKKN